jgi:NADH-quinone oxidoreductase subunit A
VSELLREPLGSGVLATQEMSDFLRDYLTVALFGAIAIGLLAGVLSLGKLVRPVRPEGAKYLTYESGVDAVGDGWAQSPIRYYVFALLFVLFDVEAVFIFPWATRLELYGWFGAIEMIIFIVLLTLGLLYAWRKKVLRWI